MKRIKAVILSVLLLFGLCGMVQSVSASSAGSARTTESEKKIGWVTDGTYRYYYLKDGTMATGWVKDQGQLYYLSKSTNPKKRGRMLTGVQKIGAHQYRFNKNGTLYTGWCKAGGKLYYYSKSSQIGRRGRMLTGTYRISGYAYHFNEDGSVHTGWYQVGEDRYYCRKSKTVGVMGRMHSGLITIGGYKYYFDSEGVMQKGWQKIGSYYYFFNRNTGRMAVDKKVGRYQVDEKGRRMDSEVIFVGDSRTVGMGSATGTSADCIAKVGMGYSWFVNTAEPRLKERLRKNPDAIVVFNFGVNDPDNADKYIARYRTLIRNYPEASFVFLSVNPIDKKYTWGYFSYERLSEKIAAFNKELKEAFPTRYIDSYTYLKKNGFATVDGIHFDSATYKKIYNYILKKIP